MDTGLVAEHFEISRRRVQQLAKQYRDNSEIPELETPGRTSYAESPDDLEERVLELHRQLDVGAAAIAHILRNRDELSIATNRVHERLQAPEHVTDTPTKQGRQRPWVRFERK
jgi:transposase